MTISVYMLVIFLLLSALSSLAFSNSVSTIRSSLNNARSIQHRKPQHSFGNNPESLNVINYKTQCRMAISSSGTFASTVASVGAKFASYLIGFGTFFVYAPIVHSILTKKSAEGYAVATWVFNLLGLTAGALYPMKKGFPLPSYVELLTLSVQSGIILGIICFFQGYIVPYTAFMTGFVGLLFAFFQFPISPSALAFLQIFSMLICNYANVPQIILNYRNKHASWSLVTAVLCVLGNLFRILTTLYYTKDLLILSGYSLGFFTNSILLLQIIFYNGLSVKK